jgi:hypothetical protein
VTPTEVYIVAAIEALLALSIIARNAYLERTAAVSHSITSGISDTKQACQSRIASNCMGSQGPTAGSVNRAPACRPCLAKARQDNNTADRRRG